MSYSIVQIAAALKTSRREFSDLFLQSQTVLPIAERIEFEAVAADYANDNEAFKKAIAYAITKNFIESFLLTVAQSSLETGAMLSILKENSEHGSTPQLQAMTNVAAGFGEPDVYLRGIMKNMRLTGKVLIDGKAEGTGILVGPNLFLTAWHVTKSLFNPSNKPKTTVNLSVEFDNFIKISGGAITSNPSLIIPAHEDWYITHSTCTDKELMNKLPNPKDGLNGYWDYTIIQLKRSLGYERSWVQISPHALIPPDDARVIVLQHPAGQTLKIDVSKITSPKPSITAIPNYRFLHDVNTLGGTSGAPIFDKEFTLIGIHQGTWPEKLDGKDVNRGIPIDKIFSHFNSSYNKEKNPLNFDNPFWCLDKIKYVPVIGRDDFQLLLWDSFLNPQSNKRLFEIKGSEGSGKTFLTRLAHSALNDLQHLKILCPGEIIGKMDVTAFINYICNATRAELPVVPPLTDLDTTIAASLRNIVSDPLLTTLDKIRDKRIVWIMITDLNKFGLEGENLSEFILLLFEAVKNTSWLRIIIDGFPSALPISIQENSQSYRTRELTYDDIVLFLNKMYTDIGWDTEQVKNIANLFYHSYSDKLPDNSQALFTLKKSIELFFAKTP